MKKIVFISSDVCMSVMVVVPIFLLVAIPLRVSAEPIDSLSDEGLVMGSGAVAQTLQTEQEPAAATGDVLVSSNAALVPSQEISSAPAANSHIENVALASSSVSITYPVQAKLFGLFSTTLTARAKVESDGSVEIMYPWYSFLYSSNQAEVLAKLERVGEAASTLQTEHLTSVQQLALLSLMHTALETSLHSQTQGSLQALQ